MKLLEQMFLDGMVWWVPEGNAKSLEEILGEPLDVIYIVRRQTEREEQ